MSKVEIAIDPDSGFCFGVKNAVTKATAALSEGEPLYSLGAMVHNPLEVNRLAEMGLKVIDNKQFAMLHNARVLFRAHGEPPTSYANIKERNIQLIDATCPVVLRLQQSIKQAYQEMSACGGQVVIFGKKGHAEVVGLLGQTDNTGIVISSPADIERIDFSLPSIIYSQTTQSVEEYFQLIDQIRKRYEAEGHPELFDYKDTICRKVASRAKQIADFATRFDAILFVSGEKSSNGLYLYNICKQHNPRSFFLTEVSQLKDIDLSDTNSIGICGATSTPMWLMQELAAECAK